MRVLFIGDIVGKKGRWALAEFMLRIPPEDQPGFVVANVENAAGGYGLTENLFKKIRAYGVHVQTSGNHIWDRPELFPALDKFEYLLRPANYPVGLPGHGSCIYKLDSGQKIGVLNIEGREFLSRIDCPFRVADAELALMRRETKLIIVDFHAESILEKQSMGFYLDGRVSAVIGTHTHVQTADEKILPQGTAFITDLGMTGPYDSILGMQSQAAVERFLSGIPHKFSVASRDPRVAALTIEIDDETGRALSVRRVLEKIPEGVGSTVVDVGDEDEDE